MDQKKILLVSTSIEGGGAAYACMRLYQALKELRILEVKLLVLNRPRKLSPSLEADPNLVFLSDSKFLKLKNFLYKFFERCEILYQAKNIGTSLWKYSTARFGLDYKHSNLFEWADIIHLHWINHGTLSLKVLRKLEQTNKPIVWTLHDLWPLTRLAHLPCLNAEDTCSFSKNFAKKRLLSIAQFNALNSTKQQAYIYIKKENELAENTYFLAVSPFVKDLALEIQPQLNQEKLHCIPPLLHNEKSLSPKPKTHYSWHRTNRYYILISSVRIDDPLKGFHLLEGLCLELKKLDPIFAEQITLLFIGEVKDKAKLKNFPLNYEYLGYINQKEEIQDLYQMAHLTLSCSLFETFGLSLAESLSYGTPVLSFDSGGARSIIQEGINGYLIENFQLEEMAKKIKQVIQEIQAGIITEELCKQSVVVFSPKAIAQKHLELYTKIEYEARTKA